MARYCGSCGTEVDETAVFCPTCGQPIDDGDATEIPTAPSWPDAAATEDRPRAVDSPDDGDALATPQGWEPEPEPPPSDVPTRVEQRPPPEQPVGSPVPRSDGERTNGRQIDLPIEMPVTLSGWLIGIGSVLAVLGLIVILIGTVLNVIDLLLLLALLGVAATVFFTARLPAVPHLRLATLVVALIAFGVALDRVGFRGGGVGELLLFMGSAAAAMGAIILELGQDQPLGGPQR